MARFKPRVPSNQKGVAGEDDCTLLANLALKTRAVLDWDAKTEQFPNHPQANEFLRYRYRAPYRFPD